MASTFVEHAPTIATRSVVFYCLWLFVIVISVLDWFLSLRYRYSLPSMELNPVGSALIAANEGRIWILLFSKLIGTVLASAIVLLIHQFRPNVGLIVCCALAVFQFCLLLFLIWGDIILLWTTVAAIEPLDAFWFDSRSTMCCCARKGCSAINPIEQVQSRVQWRSRL